MNKSIVLVGYTDWVPNKLIKYNIFIGNGYRITNSIRGCQAQCFKNIKDNPEVYIL